MMSDRMLNSKNAILAFGGIIAAATALTIFSGDQPLFPKVEDPTGDPETWSIDQLRRWLELVRLPLFVFAFWAVIIRLVSRILPTSLYFWSVFGVVFAFVVSQINITFILISPSFIYGPPMLLLELITSG